MEHRIDASTGANKDKDTFFNDISVVGLSGDFGTVRLGRTDNTFDIAADPDAFGGDYFGGRGNRRAGADEKWNNGLMYFTPEMHGFQAVIGTSFSEDAKFEGTSVDQKNPYALSILYKNGNLNSALGYMKRANEDKAVGGSVTYDFGVAKAFFTAAHNDGKGNGNGMVVDGGENGQADGKRTTYDLGVGYWHNLSKRTQLYVTGNVEKIEGQKTTHAMDMGVVHIF